MVNRNFSCLLLVFITVLTELAVWKHGLPLCTLPSILYLPSCLQLPAVGAMNYIGKSQAKTWGEKIIFSHTKSRIHQSVFTGYNYLYGCTYIKSKSHTSNFSIKSHTCLHSHQIAIAVLIISRARKGRCGAAGGWRRPTSCWQRPGRRHRQRRQESFIGRFKKEEEIRWPFIIGSNIIVHFRSEFFGVSFKPESGT